MVVPLSSTGSSTGRALSPHGERGRLPCVTVWLAGWVVITRYRSDTDRECGRMAGHTARDVADRDDELRVVIR